MQPLRRNVASCVACLAIAVLLCAVPGCALQRKMQIVGGGARSNPGDFQIVQNVGSSHVRLYALWKYLQPSVASLNLSLTVAAVKEDPSLISAWASSPSVSWSWFDNLVASYQNASIEPIVEVGEGTLNGLPVYTPLNAPVDPNVVGEQPYLAYMYLTTRAIVARYKSFGAGGRGVRLWQIENELNEAWLAGFQGQRRANLSGSWKDWKFLTTLLSTLRDGVKDSDPTAQVTMNLHTDVSKALHDLIGVRGFYLDALADWNQFMDFLSFDAYPCNFAPNASLGALVGDRAVLIMKAAPGKLTMVMETGFPVNADPLASNASLPASLQFTEAAQAQYMQIAFQSVLEAGAQGFFVFGLWPQAGVQPPGGYYTQQDGEAIALFAELYLDSKALPFIEWALKPGNLAYLEKRFAPLVSAFDKGWGIVDAATGKNRQAFATLQQLFAS